MGYDLRPMSANNDDPILLALREEIATADRDLLAAFTRRLRVAAKIRSHKAECGYDYIDLERENQLLDEWRSANGGAVSDETLLELFDSVLGLSKRETRED
jgi:chorismate mutase